MEKSARARPTHLSLFASKLGNPKLVGWVGEAGAMAIAAEALGLGISSNDPSQSRAERPSFSFSETFSFLEQ